MNIEKNSLTFAYVIFLIVGVIVYVVSAVLGFEYTVWKQIVAAATVASYCFSITGVFKSQTAICESTKNSYEKMLQLVDKENDDIKSVIKELKSSDHFVEKTETIEKNHALIINKIKDSINRNYKKIKNAKRCILIIDTLGYLLFFCILAFVQFYNCISTSQDLLTLLAFILILISDYTSEYISYKIAKELEILHLGLEEYLKKAKEVYPMLQHMNHK